MKTFFIILTFAFSIQAQSQHVFPTQDQPQDVAGIDASLTNFMYDVREVLSAESVQEKLNFDGDQELEITGIRKVTGNSESLILEYNRFRYSRVEAAQANSEEITKVSHCSMEIETLFSSAEPGPSGDVIAILYLNYVAKDPVCSKESRIQ